ncbi:UNVERIFIED_CONTAM: hypothetical protein GTU68_009755 [Idotea baltica]
MHLLW